MENVNTTPESPATESAAPKRSVRKVNVAKPKAASAPKTVKAKPEPKAAVERAPKEPMVNPHIAAGLDTSLYTGPSQYVNANRKPKVLLGRAVAPAKLTDRAKAGLYALRKTYGGRQFQPKGFDNGILRDLLASGMIQQTGGVKSVIDGAEYLVDGADNPVKLQITGTGLSFGKA